MTPDDYTIQETMLDVGDGHILYVHEWGNPKAKTAIINLHGGPGGQSKDKYKQLFNPLRQRVIFFDQRGCGKSTPYGSLEDNTTAKLIEDINKVAKNCKLEQFILFGASWGSCLALAYAIEHPTKVKSMVLSGVFTASKPEIAWLDDGMFRIFYPDTWDAYLKQTPVEHQDKPTEFHFKNILSDDLDARKRSAYAYENLEGSIVKLDDRTTPDSFDTYDPSGIRIETYYMANACFMPNNYILDNAKSLTMPVWIVQGRYDMVCPPKTAHTLAERLPKGELIWTTSGHVSERESWNVIRTLLGQIAS